MKQATVLGATGFVGSHLVAQLRQRGQTVFVPDRDADLTGVDLGTVYYCIGLTADFRERPFDTVTAHVSKLGEILQRCRFQMLVYLSSTRLYAASAETTEEQSLRLNPADPDQLYNLSKAMGEALALSSGRPVRIVRLSNVYGPDWRSAYFLPSLIRSAVCQGKVALRISQQSAKDYVSIDDVVELLIRIGSSSKHRIYNAASGRRVTVAALTDCLQKLCGCEVEAAAGAPHVVFPPIAIGRIQEEFGFAARCVLDDLPKLVKQYSEREGLAAA